MHLGEIAGKANKQLITGEVILLLETYLGTHCEL